MSRETQQREMRMGTNETMFFIGFAPPLSKEDWQHVAKPDQPYAKAELGEGQRTQMLSFYRGTFGWSEAGRSAAFSEECQRIADQLPNTTLCEELTWLGTAGIEALFEPNMRIEDNRDAATAAVGSTA